MYKRDIYLTHPKSKLGKFKKIYIPSYICWKQYKIRKFRKLEIL